MVPVWECAQSLVRELRSPYSVGKGTTGYNQMGPTSEKKLGHQAGGRWKLPV